MDRRTLLRVLGGATVSIAGLPPQELTALVKATGRRVPQPREVRTTLVAEQHAEWMTSEERERFMRGLAHLDEHTQALAAVRFAHAEVSLQVAILEGLEAEGRALGGASTEFPEMYGEEEDAVSMPFFHSIRALVSSTENGSPPFVVMVNATRKGACAASLGLRC